MSEPRAIDVQILGRSYRVSCRREEEQALIAAADYLDQKMREIRDSNRVIGLERIAIMAGLNLAHDLLAGGRGGLMDEAQTRIAQCTALLDAVLDSQDELF